MSLGPYLRFVGYLDSLSIVDGLVIAFEMYHKFWN